MPAEEHPLPVLYCPLPRALHPAADEVGVTAITWMRRFGLCASETKRTRLEQSGCGRMASYMLPSAQREVLQIAADLCMWNLAFDDEYCDEGPLGQRPGELAEVLAHIQRAIEVPEIPLYTSDRYAVALLDIRVRLDRCATPAQVSRWVEGMRIWLMTEPWRSGIEARELTLSLDEYALMRLRSGGMFGFLALSPIGAGFEISSSELADRRVHALTEMAATLCTWSADIIGHIRDRRDERGNNLLTVIQRDYDCSPPEAVAWAAAMHEQIMRLFLRLREQVLEQTSPGTARYLRSLDHYIRCGIDWVQESRRYTRSAEAEPPPAPEPKKVHGAAPDLAAQGIPSIAWWWQYDPDKQMDSPTPTKKRRI